MSDRCTHPGCHSLATSRSPLYCWGHYIDHVLMLKPCPGAPKKVTHARFLPTAPLRERLDALLVRSIASAATNDHRTLNHVARECHTDVRKLHRVYEEDHLRWDVVDSLCGKLGVATAALYGFTWTAMDVENAA